MPFVAERWLGGCLTNFRTIRSRLGRLEEVEKIRGGEQIATYSKKAQSALAREYRKMYRNLNGIRSLNRMPECLVIIDPNKEKNAIKEARSLGITTVFDMRSDAEIGQYASTTPPVPGVRVVRCPVTSREGYDPASLAKRCVRGAFRGVFEWRSRPAG